MTKRKQIVMHCPCGRAKVLAKGLCSTCYTLRRQDEAYFGGHREEVLKRNDYRCRVPGCTTLKRGKRSVAVHHREPGKSDPAKDFAQDCLDGAFRRLRYQLDPDTRTERACDRPGLALRYLSPSLRQCVEQVGLVVGMPS